MKKIHKKVLIFFRHPRLLISKKYLSEYMLISILLIAMFFRFYNTPMRYVLDFDPTRDALINLVGETQFKFPQVGPKSGIAPFTFGPWYYYQTIIFSILAPFDYAPWIYIGITSVFTVLIYYLIGKNLEDKKLGLIIAAFVAITPAELGPITGLSNPNLIPIQAAFALLFFVLYIKKVLPWYWIIFWGLMIGIGINNHYQAFGLLFLPAIAFIVKRKNFFQHIILLGLGLFLSFIPLIIFNINHQWHTIAGFIQYVEQGRSTVPDRWVFYVRDFWPHFVAYVLGVPTIFGYIIFGYIGLVFIYLAYLRKINAIYYWLFVVFLLNFIFLRYGTSIRENYYFIYMHGFIFIFVSYALWQTFKNRCTTICSLLLISGILFFILKEDIRRLKSEEFVVDVHVYKEIIEKNYPNKSFVLYSCGDRSRAETQALVFLLYHDHRLSESGMKIGIPSDDCTDSTIYKKETLDKRWYYVSLKHAKPETLKQYWIKTTPESVYKTNEEWWK